MTLHQVTAARAVKKMFLMFDPGPKRLLSMGTNIVTGSSKGRREGFTLLELMIVISIIIILASIALPQYQKTIMHAREAVLRDDLYKMRSLLDQYAADKGKLPQSLEELVTARYMRELPVDPITGEKDWSVVSGEDPNST